MSEKDPIKEAFIAGVKAKDDKIAKEAEQLNSWDKFRFSFYSGLIAASTQMAGVMANQESAEITQTLLITTALTFAVHYAKEAKNFLSARINNK